MNIRMHILCVILCINEHWIIFIAPLQNLLVVSMLWELNLILSTSSYSCSISGLSLCVFPVLRPLSIAAYFTFNDKEGAIVVECVPDISLWP